HYYIVFSSAPDQTLPSLTQTKRSSYAIWFRVRPEPLTTLPPNPNLLEVKTAFFAFLLIGDRTCFFIPTSIVSFREAESPSMAPGGSPADLVSSCPYGCCPVCSADCS